MRKEDISSFIANKFTQRGIDLNTFLEKLQADLEKSNAAAKGASLAKLATVFSLGQGR
jgi:hypothetical protein